MQIAPWPPTVATKQLTWRQPEATSQRSNPGGSNAQNALRQDWLINQQISQRKAGIKTALRAALANQSTRLQTGRTNRMRHWLALANQNALNDAARMRLNAANQQLAWSGSERQHLCGHECNSGRGDMQQQQSQRILDDLFAQFQDERDFPLRMFDVLKRGGYLPNPLTSRSSQRGFNVGFRIN